MITLSISLPGGVTITTQAIDQERCLLQLPPGVAAAPFVEVANFPIPPQPADMTFPMAPEPPRVDEGYPAIDRNFY